MEALLKVGKDFQIFYGNNNTFPLNNCEKIEMPLHYKSPVKFYLRGSFFKNGETFFNRKAFDCLNVFAS